jgi:hypothetical protein
MAKLYWKSVLEIVAVVLVVPGIVAASSDQNTRARTVERGSGHLVRDARLLQEYQRRLDDYIAMRSWIHDPRVGEQADASSFEAEDGTPSELLCLPSTVPAAPVMGHDPKRRPREAFDRFGPAGDGRGPESRLLFDRELEDFFRAIVARVLTPVDEARVMRVMPLFQTGVPVHVVSEELLGALPPLPEGLEYRFFKHDLLVMDLDADVVVDSIALVIGPDRT